MHKQKDSNKYRQKKAFFEQLLTVYGRKPVLEILNDHSIDCYRLHLARSNKDSAIIKHITQAAQTRGIEIQYHERQALSRISKNSKQDQGVCIDINCAQHQHYRTFLQQHLLQHPQKNKRLFALDRITNPQNLGMIIRAACAGDIDGILVANKGCAKLDSLVIKASAGTLFKAPILHCDKLAPALNDFKQAGADIIGLGGHSTQPLASYAENTHVIYLLGNETDGLSKDMLALCHKTLLIPMNNGVESLNVAVTAGLLAFRHRL
ncbi:MAG: RNA methyltransferase [Cellvibrionaceae bacterium]|nr:RNA methyltransferase [Cellvibrionaceae bacterium]